MRVFISHGLDKQQAGQLQFLDELAAALAARTPGGDEHEILVDRTRLDGGDDWAGVLLDCLDECDRAVLVLTERALTRPWVWKEATILDFRHRRRDGFRLYPVCIGAGLHEKIAAVPALAALDLADIQMFDAAVGAAQIAAHIHQQLDAAPQPGGNQIERVAESLAAQLGGADGGQLDLLLKSLAAPLAFKAGTDAGRRRGLGLARAIVGGRLGPGGLSALLGRLRMQCAVNPAALDNIRELAAPLWVASEAASALARHRDDVLGGGPQLAAALFAARPPFSGRMVTYRQLLPDLPLPGRDVVLPLPGGGSGRGADEIEALLLAQYGRTRGDMPADVAREMLADPLQTFYVLLPPPLPLAEDMAVLRGRYPKLVWIAHPGAVTRDELPAGYVPLPPLDAAAERQHLQQYIEAGGTLPR